MCQELPNMSKLNFQTQLNTVCVDSQLNTIQFFFHDKQKQLQPWKIPHKSTFLFPSPSAAGWKQTDRKKNLVLVSQQSFVQYFDKV